MAQFSIQVDQRDVAEVKRMLSGISGKNARAACSRGINKTMTGVRNDGTSILSSRYALSASYIRNTWKISNSAMRDMHGVVSTCGTWLRLIKFGARQEIAGVSVKILKSEGRKIIQHAFMGRIKGNQKTDQVYRRKYHDENHGKSTATQQTAMMNQMGYVWSSRAKRWIAAKSLPSNLRFPVRALYGPRIQDYLADPEIAATLSKMAGDRLTKNMEHEIEYLLTQIK